MADATLSARSLALTARRGAVLALAALWAATALPARAETDPAFCAVDPSRPDIVAACYTRPTDRYGHGVFGQAPGEPGEWAALRVTLKSGETRERALPKNRVFEDMAPRLVDLDRDGRTEILTIEADLRLGGSLALYGLEGGRLTARARNEPIGTANRWLAPAGIADFDGDGDLDIAYVDRPHLAGVLRIVTLEGDRLVPLRFQDGRPASKSGYSNHRFGERAIWGAARDCGDGLEIILPDMAWSAIMRVRVTPEGFVDRRTDIAPTPTALRRAQACPPR